MAVTYLSEDKAETLHGPVFPEVPPFELQPQAPVEHHASPELRELFLLPRREQQKKRFTRRQTPTSRESTHGKTQHNILYDTAESAMTS